MTVPARVKMHPAGTGKPGLTVRTIETIVRTKRFSMKGPSLYGLP